MSDRLDEATLARLEREHEAGLSSAEILTLLEQHGVKFSEATLRKYVQLGLLPRSVRVGRKGKHQGSQGMYPVAVVRQILRIKEMMADDLTIEQIQREILENYYFVPVFRHAFVNAIGPRIAAKKWQDVFPTYETSGYPYPWEDIELTETAAAEK